MKTKERPDYRRAIIKQDIRPWVVRGEWDGFSYITKNGLVGVLRPDSMRKQMRLMLKEGFFGPEARALGIHQWGKYGNHAETNRPTNKLP